MKGGGSSRKSSLLFGKQSVNLHKKEDELFNLTAIAFVVEHFYVSSALHILRMIAGLLRKGM